MGDTITGDGYTLHCGDALEVMRTLPDSSVDLIATDPPYHRVKKNEPWDMQWDTADGFLSWLDTVAAEWWRVLRPNGSLYVFASPKMAARVEVLIGERFNVLNNIRWIKPDDNSERRHVAQLVDKDLARSYYPSGENIIFAEHHNADTIAKGEAGYVRACDELRGFVFEPLRAYLDGERERAGVTKSAVNKLFDGPNVGQYWWQERNWQLPTRENYEILRQGVPMLNHGGQYFQRPYEDLRREYEDLRRPFNATPDAPYTDVWEFPTVQAYAGKHPCEKPPALMRHIIEMSSKPGATVLDSFGGHMTTGVACLQTGRQFIGIEKSRKYFESGAARMAETMMQPELFTEAAP